MRRGASPCLAAVTIALIAGACGPRAGLFPLTADQVLRRGFDDDLDFEGLAGAVERSAAYYRTAPGAVFRYGDLAYTGAEMEASTRLFLDTLAGFRGPERARALGERFLFFESRNSGGKAFFTGYYEPVLQGSRTRSEGFGAPLYGIPGDLLTVDLGPYIEMGLLPEGLENRTLKGKIAGKRVIPYDGREEITSRSSLEGRAEAIVYLRSQVDLSLLQIQGSGLIRLEDGTTLRLNYADQNGHPYRPIGRALLGRIPREEMSLQRIRDYLTAHPEEVRSVLAYNPSYTFFRVVEEGPLGDIQVPLTPGRSVAMDRREAPRGGLVYFETSYPLETAAGGGSPLRIRRFGVVQDTGGAIRGPGRVDVFWGSGVEAERIAGPMKEEGRVWLLVARKAYLGGYLSPSEKPIQE